MPAALLHSEVDAGDANRDREEASGSSKSPACYRRAKDHGCYAAEQEAARDAFCCGVIFVFIGSVVPHGSAGQILGSCAY